MDWLVAGIIGALMYWLGTIAGYRLGFVSGQERERISRKIDELTGTRRV